MKFIIIKLVITIYIKLFVLGGEKNASFGTSELDPLHFITYVIILLFCNIITYFVIQLNLSKVDAQT